MPVPSAGLLNNLKQPDRRHFQDYCYPPFLLTFFILCFFYSWKYIPIYAILCFTGYILARVLYVEYVWGDMFRTLPHPPRKLFTGSAHLLQPGLTAKTLREWNEKYGPIVGIKVLPGMAPTVAVSSPDALRTIMTTHNTPKGTGLRLLENGISFRDAEGSGWLGTGLVTSNGDLWKARRNLITPTFHFQILQSYMNTFISRTDVFVSNMEKMTGSASVNVFPHVKNLVLDIISACAFGFDLEAQTSDSPHEYVNAVDELASLVFRRTRNPIYQISWIFRLLPMGRRWAELTEVIHRLPDRLIQERRQYIKEHPEDAANKKRLDFLDLLLTVEDENGDKLNDRAIREEANTFLFGGHDTTASGVSFILYCLAKHPEYQERARREIIEVLQDREAPTYDEAKTGFPFLDLCIKETFRIYPPVPLNTRYLDVPLELEGYTIPAHTEISLALYSVHMDPKYWKAPETFNPNRFNEGIAHPYAYVPFSAGHRSCIGQAFALLEAKTIVAILLKKFRFKVDESQPFDLENYVVLRPKKGTGVHLFIEQIE